MKWQMAKSKWSRCSLREIGIPASDVAKQIGTSGQIVFLFFCALILFGCAKNVGPSGLGKVVGAITDSQTQKPIGGASITYLGNVMKFATSNSDGTYGITIPTGWQELNFAKDGYQAKAVKVNVIGEAAVTLNVELTPNDVTPKAARVTVSPTSVTLKIGQKQKFEIKAYDKDNSAITEFTVTTFIDPASLGSLSNDGTFTAKEAGEGTLTIKVGNVSAKATIIVN